MKNLMRSLLMAMIFIFLFTTFAAAQTLKIGLAGETSSTDPHFHNVGPNNALAYHFFDRLVHQDDKQRLFPGLAESWKPVSPTTWVFNLRKGVKWHDGSDFTAADVIYTIERIPNVPNSPSSFTSFVKQIKEYKVINDYQIQFETKTTFPLMAAYMSSFSIISKAAAQKFIKENPGIAKDIYSISSKYYNDGTLLIGTGPYKFVEWVKGDRIVLKRNDGYWGDKAKWEKVIFKPISSGSARMAALLSGDVDVIDKVPTADIETLTKNNKVNLSQGISNRVIYLHIDTGRDDSPHVTDIKGNKMGKNPLKDQRVRLAISKAINRKAIASRVMQGLSIPAAQTLPDGFFGVSANIQPEEYDPKGAKELLSKAGYPDGFGLTIHGPNNRYINDAKIVQAIAQFLTKVGIKTKVETMPKNVYFSRATQLEFSFMLLGWGSDTGEPGSTMMKLLHTYDKENSMGTSNRGRFSDKKFDNMIETAMSTVDAAKREQMLKECAEYAFGEKLGFIPVHFQVNTWGAKKGLKYHTRTDEYTLAMFVEQD
ncbi:MAG: ABC transporter substrate-binding protein [Desulfobacteraceae bacterium]|nr:ABC transporter substrate-binding protein [Desulfobacteraceae bacterium]